MSLNRSPKQVYRITLTEITFLHILTILGATGLFNFGQLDEVSTRRNEEKEICTRIKDKLLIHRRIDKEAIDVITDGEPHSS